MGEYYRGVDEWFSTLTTNLRTLISRSNVPVIVSGIHKLWPGRCKDKSSPCNRCNKYGKEELFREALEEVLSCQASNMAHGKIVQGRRLEYFNTLGHVESQPDLWL